MAKTLKAVEHHSPDQKHAAGTDLFGDQSTQEVLDFTRTDELVIALCGPIGSPLHEVADKLREMLCDTFGYQQCHIIKLSGFIEAHAERARVPISQDPAQRRHDLITHGNRMRETYGHSVLAELAVHDICIDRQKHGQHVDTGQYKNRRVCHIVNSIKNQHELDLLRTVYQEALHVVGVFSPLPARETALRRLGMDNQAIAGLMDRDSGEEGAGGQTVQTTFPQCDFFLRMDSNTDTQLRGRVERFLHLILRTKVITPTRAEAAMYAAASAAANSACLSRQVGAAVTDEEGELLAVGWNDVPRAFGDLYVTEMADGLPMEGDKRCWNFGAKCYNDEEKDGLARQLVESLGDLISGTDRLQAIEKVRKDRRLRGLIEFSRSIHAEMHAILRALRHKGDRVRRGRLYVTTYPCHACARHIIAAGISTVIYIEPYAKSLAIRLHEDAMSESEEAGDKVRLLAYDGVAPARYLSLFRMKPDSRKRNGRVIHVSPSRGAPQTDKSLESMPALEKLVVKSLRSKHLVDHRPNEASDHDPAGTTVV